MISIIALLALIIGIYVLLSWDITKSKERSDEGRANLHQRISTLETSLGELTTSTNNSYMAVVENSHRIYAMRLELDTATERLGLVAEVLKPTVLEEGE